jgi:hypothetical protein
MLGQKLARVVELLLERRALGAELALQRAAADAEPACRVVGRALAGGLNCSMPLALAILSATSSSGDMSPIACMKAK